MEDYLEVGGLPEDSKVNEEFFAIAVDLDEGGLDVGGHDDSGDEDKEEMKSERTLSLSYLSVITRDELTAMAFLRTKLCLMRTPPMCKIEDCHRKMTQIKCRNRYLFRCPSHKSKSQPSIRRGSLFITSQLPLTKNLEIIWCWALSIPPKTSKYIVDLSGETMWFWYAILGKVCDNVLKCTAGKAASKDALCASDLATKTSSFQDFVKELKNVGGEKQKGFRKKLTTDLKVAEAKWRRLYARTPVDAFDKILDHIAIFFPTP